MLIKKQLNNLWEETTKANFRCESLRCDIDAEVVVIGGGYTGISAALYLAQKGVDVVLLEKQTIGYGGSGRNVGFVNAGLWTPPDEVEGVLGSEGGAKLNAALADGPQLVFDLIEKNKIKCSAKRNATLHCAETFWQIKGLKSRYDQQIARGAPVKFLGEVETLLRTGSKKFIASLWDPRAGTIQPMDYAKGLAAAAVKAGANICENSPAKIIRHDGDVWNITTPNGSVKAKKLIQATNAYSSVNDENGLYNNEFIRVHYFQMATEPLPLELRKLILPNGEGCWNCAMVMSSFRLDEDGRMLVGAVGNLSGLGGAVHQAWAKRKLISVYPQLAGIKMSNAWHGRISMTSDHLPKVVNFGPNALSIFGFSGRGISPGTVFGKYAADWAVSGDENAFPVAITVGNSEYFKAIKSVYYEAGATATHFIGARF